MGKSTPFSKQSIHQLFAIIEKGNFKDRQHNKAIRLLRKRKNEGKLSTEEEIRRKEIIKKLCNTKI